MGHPMVMGVNTFKSLPGLLPGRLHIVISDRPFEHPPEVMVFGNLDDFFVYARKYEKEVFVIGGGIVYKQLLPYSNRLILTEVHEKFDGKAEECIYFPDFDRNEWKVEQRDEFVDPVSDVKYSRAFFRRK